MYTENDNIDWDKINALSKLPSDELDKRIAEEEEEIKKQMKMLSRN